MFPHATGQQATAPEPSTARKQMLVCSAASDISTGLLVITQPICTDRSVQLSRGILMLMQVVAPGTGISHNTGVTGRSDTSLMHSDH